MKSTAVEEIDARREWSFRHLRCRRINPSTIDDFESFLMDPATLARPSLIVRCRINRHGFDIRVVIDKSISRCRLESGFLPLLNRVADRIHGQAEFFVLISDRLYLRESLLGNFNTFVKKVPFFRCDQSDHDESSYNAILIPDFSIQEDGYAAELPAIRDASNAIPFEKRTEKIKWRGRLSGPDYPNHVNCVEFPRHKLLMLSLKFPNIVDARLTTYRNLVGSDSADALRRDLQATFGDPAAEVPAKDFVQYKYLISLDGAVAAWKRVPTILASKSVLLLQHDWSQFFYPGLKPWVHYVPIDNNLSNLLTRYQWLQEHPLDAKEIGENGQNFAHEILEPSALDSYFVETINLCCGLPSG